MPVRGMEPRIRHPDQGRASIDVMQDPVGLSRVRPKGETSASNEGSGAVRARNFVLLAGQRASLEDRATYQRARIPWRRGEFERRR